MIQNIKESLKNYFENESNIAPNLDVEKGYSERDIDWMKSNLIPRIKNLVVENISKNCLDVGCAYGYFTKVLSETFEQTYGIDLSSNRIEYAKKYETDTMKFVQSDLTESFVNKFPVKFDFMFTNAVLPHIPLRFKSDVFKNLAEVANTGCIFVMYDGLLSNDNDQCGFESWDGSQMIKVVLVSENWIRENAPDWEIVQINNVSPGTEEIILRKK
jgi:2-polyprenyl-3-methyl-5-hydroxy-6-metoxy-1,4-benzoquinol methylase